MELIFNDNEFTSSELLRYFKAAFGLKVNGSSFTINCINNWIRLKKIPDAYGGHKVLFVERIHTFNNIKVIALDGLTRDVLDSLTLLKPGITKPLPKVSRPRKHRTALYYQILENAGMQYTRQTKASSTLPNNWKEIGIKSNQLARKSNGNKRQPK